MTAETAAHPSKPSNITRKAQMLTLIAAFLGWMFDGMEMGIFGQVARPALLGMAPDGVSAEVAEKFVQDWMGIVTATFLLGAAGGGLVFGWLGDKIGRVKSMTLSILCYSLFTGLCYFAQSPWQFGVFRFIAALGMGGEWSLGVALVMEIWPSRLRPLMAGFIGAAANVGFVLVGIMGYLWPATGANWRWYFVVGAVPALLTFVIRIFVPESEKWKEAVEGKQIKPLKEIFSAPLLKYTIMATIFASVPLLVTWGIVQWIPLWTDQMAGPDNPGAKGASHFVVAFGAIVGSLGAPLLGQLWGRRITYFLICLCSLISSYVLFMVYNHYSIGFMTAVFFVGMFSASFFGWLPLYLPELFPTRVRATAQGVAFNAGRILAAAGVWNMGAIMALFGGSYNKAGFAICFVYVIGMLIIWLAPETKGKPLPE